MSDSVLLDGRSSFPKQAGLLARAWRAVERTFDAAFERDNPWHHLGASAFFLFWIIAVTGVYLYALFDTSVTGAWRSIQTLTVEQWYLGGVIRSLHRYASDAFVLVVLLHLARELVLGRYRGFRWFSWLTGLPLIWLMYASGIGGYWLVWDELAQFSIIATAEWLDWLPLGGAAVIRNFVGDVDDRFFSLLIFLHIGIPLLLLAFMWLHVQRISHARTFPPRSIAIGTLVILVVVSVVRPAQSHAPADFAAIPNALAIDWFYLAFHPFQYLTTPGALWALAGAMTLVLAALPALARRPRAPAAVVSPSYCNGCGRCFEDCPFAAVILEPRPGSRYRLARVLEDQCAGCGICAGACPSSTPFQGRELIVSGIDIPQQRVTVVRQDVDRVLASLQGPRPWIMVFGCLHSADAQRLQARDTGVVRLECTGMLPPSFIEYALRSGADGVLVTGCPSGECEYRLGPAWVEERLAGKREPHLRANVAAERLRVTWVGAGDEVQLVRELASFRMSLARVGSLRAAPTRPTSRRRQAHD